MSVFDIATPAGTESANQGDDRIREFKVAMQDALRGETTEGLEAVFPGNAPSTAPVFRYRGLKGATGARPAAGQYGLFFDTTRQVLQRDNGSSWDDIGTVIPAGSVMVFYQAAAPTGWTQILTQNDKALRVVSGAGGVAGGTTGLAGGITHSIGAHTHTTPDTSHTHILNTTTSQGSINYTAANSVGTDAAGHAMKTITAGGGETVNYKSDTTNSGGAAGVSGSTTPTCNTVTLAYVDVLLCSKD